ncbi:hypothetical protein [Ornithinibacter aureus]|uniref:hypothetical protein n=1 Tax=Ornithinibacter aureus TaxID=622664 RepID=UPI001357642F|nr:hypothetical protein [Ornithinibacter aureus]
MHAEEIIVGETAGSARILEIFSERGPLPRHLEAAAESLCAGCADHLFGEYRPNSWRGLQSILDGLK